MKPSAKYALFLFLLLSGTTAMNAKNYKKEFDELKQYQKLQLADSLYDYRFTVVAVSKEKPQSEKTYTWYMKNAVLVTQGNYSGKLLHGTYTKYYCKTNQLAEKGDYKYGLKEGVWQEWNSNGTLSSNVTYKKGVKKGEAVFYDSSGNIVEKCIFKNDKKHGKSYTYVNGIEQKPVTYKKGVIKEKKSLFARFKKKSNQTELAEPTEKTNPEKIKPPKEVKQKEVKQKEEKPKKKETKEKNSFLKNIFKKKPKGDKKG
jgi:antitoxin component YwqK of YwqJK toxin-antitoxin module